MDRFQVLVNLSCNRWLVDDRESPMRDEHVAEFVDEAAANNLCRALNGASAELRSRMLYTIREFNASMEAATN